MSETPLPLPETHFGLTIFPRRPATPGSEVALRYRIANSTAHASAPATVRFLVPPELVLQDDAEHALHPIAAGAVVVVERIARVARPLSDGTRLRVQVALELPGEAPQGSNAVTIDVSSAARIARAHTIVRIEATALPDVVRIAAEVENVGDDIASGLVLHLPAPAGTEPVAPAQFSLAGLAPGERATFAYDAVVTTPPHGGQLIVADAAVFDGETPHAALPPSNILTLASFLEPPHIACIADGRRMHIAIRAKNQGWAACGSVTLALRWPSGYAIASGSLARDGAPLAAPRAGTFAIDLGTIDARSETCISMDLYAGADADPGTFAAHLNAEDRTWTECVALTPPERGELRLFASNAARAVVVAGSSYRTTLTVVNATFRSRSVTIAADDARLELDGKVVRPDRPIRLSAGARRTIDLVMSIPADAAHGTMIGREVFLRDGSTTLAQTTASALVRNRAWFALACESKSDEPEMLVEHRGATDVRDAVAILGTGERIRLGTFAAGTSVQIPSCDNVRIAYDGGAVDLARNPKPQTDRHAPDWTFDTDAAIGAGSTTTVRLRACTAQALESVVIHVGYDGPLATVPGSVCVNGLPLADRPAGPVIHTAAGLQLHHVPAGTTIELAWAILADATSAAADAVILVHTTADEAVLPAARQIVAVIPQSPFARAEATLPFHIEGIARDNPQRADDTHADPSIFDEPVTEDAATPHALVCDDSPVRRIANARFLRGASMPGLLSHVLSLRALFPDDDRAGTHAAAVVTARDRVRDALDRIYVKARIPGYRATIADLDDAGMRTAIFVLADSVGSAVPVRAHAAHAILLPYAIAADFVRDAQLADAEIGAAVFAYADALGAAIAVAAGDDIADGDFPALTRRRAHLIDVLDPAAVMSA